MTEWRTSGKEQNQELQSEQIVVQTLKISSLSVKINPENGRQEWLY